VVNLYILYIFIVLHCDIIFMTFKPISLQKSYFCNVITKIYFTIKIIDFFYLHYNNENDKNKTKILQCVTENVG